MSSRTLLLLMIGPIGLAGAVIPAMPAQTAPLEQLGASASWSWLGPEGEPLPWTSEEEALEFLRTASVVSRKEISTGINRTLKVRLEDEQGVAANAAFRTVDVRDERVRISGVTYRDFRDSHIFECAAYRLSRLLGMDNVPPCVRRSLKGTSGTLQLWVEKAMNEKQRRDQDLEPPDAVHWARQRQMMRLFDSLIHNIDRNQGNMLIGPDWKLWFIDHTRGFQFKKSVQNPTTGGPVVWCERGVWERLQALNKPLLKEEFTGLLTPRHIAYLLMRRDRLVEHLQALIDANGEGTVLFDWSEDGGELGDELEALGDEDIPESADKSAEDPDA